MMVRLILLLTILIIIFSCQHDKGEMPATSFMKLSPDQSGISFSNTITESDTFNYYTYPYLYMGGGVAIGDINNDGWLDIAHVDMTPADHKRSKTNMASMSPGAFYQAGRLGFHYQYFLQLNRSNVCL